MLLRPMQTKLLRVRRVRDLGGDSFALEIDGPIPTTLPGQFFMLRTERHWPVLLPRPFSLFDRAADGSWGSFLIKVAGPGTKALVEQRTGEGVHVTGPLGRPFSDDVLEPVCIAGGIGLAPFLSLARRYRELGRPLPRLLFGGRNQAALAGIEDFAGIARVFASTDDGSHGFHGLVTQLLDSLLVSKVVQPGETVFLLRPRSHDARRGEAVRTARPALLFIAGDLHGMWLWRVQWLHRRSARPALSRLAIFQGMSGRAGLRKLRALPALIDCGAWHLVSLRHVTLRCALLRAAFLLIVGRVFAASVAAQASVVKQSFHKCLHL